MYSGPFYRLRRKILHNFESKNSWNGLLEEKLETKTWNIFRGANFGKMKVNTIDDAVENIVLTQEKNEIFTRNVPFLRETRFGTARIFFYDRMTSAEP